MVKAYKYYQSLCKFLSDVKCPHRHTAKQRKSFSVNRFCFQCPQYGRYVTRFEENEDLIDDAVVRLDAVRERWVRGEISEDEFRRLYFLIDREIDGVVV